MSNFKDFTRAIAGIAAALKGINTVVDDIPVPGSGGSSEWTFSTTPHKIGTWSDGSEIWEASFTGTTASGAETTVAHNLENVGKLVGVFGNIEKADGYCITFGGKYTNVYLNDTNYIIEAQTTSGLQSRPYTLSILYTKATASE